MFRSRRQRSRRRRECARGCDGGSFQPHDTFAMMYVCCMTLMEVPGSVDKRFRGDKTSWSKTGTRIYSIFARGHGTDSGTAEAKKKDSDSVLLRLETKQKRRIVQHKQPTILCHRGILCHVGIDLVDVRLNLGREVHGHFLVKQRGATMILMGQFVCDEKRWQADSGREERKSVLQNRPYYENQMIFCS